MWLACSIPGPTPPPSSNISSCPTTSGPDSECSFPFLFQGIFWTGCTTVGGDPNHSWCVTQTNEFGYPVFEEDSTLSNWGYCHASCPIDQGLTLCIRMMCLKISFLSFNIHWKFFRKSITFWKCRHPLLAQFQGQRHHRLPTPPPAPLHLDRNLIPNANSLSSSRELFGPGAPLLMKIQTIPTLGVSHRRTSLAFLWSMKMVFSPPGVIAMSPAQLIKVWHYFI